MTNKLLAAATLMLVTTASAWAESAEGVARLSTSIPDKVEVKQEAGTSERERQSHATSGLGESGQ